MALLSSWIQLAILSGVCAATNGLFAKLTTTTLTTSIAASLATLFGLPGDSKFIEYLVRGGFFALNLIFNGVMWGLFTAALTRGSSATKVSVVNTSANFMVTAIMGWWIFSEALPPMWWVGAAMLVAGNVIIGGKDNEKEKEKEGAGYQPVAGNDDTDTSELRTRDGSSESESESDERDNGLVGEGRS
ncbi:hypothetical protein EDC01DRAFT_614858 [Geopyxis carbonaria]|nr:hypothetical protein EDC01DRAFT_614858 [Geopyxis carbonaria]